MWKKDFHTDGFPFYSGKMKLVCMRLIQWKMFIFLREKFINFHGETIFEPFFDVNLYDWIHLR